MKPSIGTSVIDSSRPNLGVGVLQCWTTHPQLGKVCRVRFAAGIKLVTRKHCRYATSPAPRVIVRKPPVMSDEALIAKRYGLTVRQYREAIEA